ncbi:MAG TPA: hypothetical protein VLH40_05275 [Atribacteraceae bacterium]|nr:hypothetical protein [Atribacteraceae bacterium]
MRSREFPFVIVLAVALGLLIYLNLGIAGRVLLPVPETKIIPTLPVRTPQPLLDLPLVSELPPEEITPRFYPETKLLAYRNLFLMTAPFTRPAEEAFIPEPALLAPVPEIPTEVDLPPERIYIPEIEIVEVLPPEFTLRGIVLSEERQAVVLEIDGVINILTTEQPLSMGVKLVKVEANSVVLEYRGREYQLTLDE